MDFESGVTKLFFFWPLVKTFNTYKDWYMNTRSMQIVQKSHDIGNTNISYYISTLLHYNESKHIKYLVLAQLKIQIYILFQALTMKMPFLN